MSIFEFHQYYQSANRSIFLSISLIVFLTLTIFQLNNGYLGGYLSNKSLTAKELKSTPDELYDWKLSQEAPFKYRVLFKYIISSAYRATNSTNSHTFYLLLKYFNLFFLIASAVSFFYLLFFLFKNINYALLGVIFYLSSPAIIMAFSLPVHTREDHLGFTILNIGLYSLFKRKWGWFITLCILGVMARETLMILPFVYLFFIKHKSFSFRLFISSIPFITLVFLRITLGYESYDVGLGLRWNMNNLDQVIGFSFITFSWMWVPFFYNFKYTLTKGNTTTITISNEMDILIKSAPFVLILVLFTTFFGGIFNEIRLIYIIYPWVIVSTLYSFNTMRILRTARQLWKSKYFTIFLVTVFSVLISLLFYILNNNSIFPPSKFQIPVQSWVIISIVQLFLFCAFLYIFIYRIKKINNETTQEPPS